MPSLVHDRAELCRRILQQRLELLSRSMSLPIPASLLANMARTMSDLQMLKLADALIEIGGALAIASGQEK
jgi:hypothetical protein